MALRDGYRREGRRFGRLEVLPTIRPRDGEQVRCACDRCGAHLLATAVGGGTLAGTCPVCLSQEFRPVGR